MVSDQDPTSQYLVSGEMSDQLEPKPVIHPRHESYRDILVSIRDNAVFSERLVGGLGAICGGLLVAFLLLTVFAQITGNDILTVTSDSTTIPFLIVVVLASIGGLIFASRRYWKASEVIYKQTWELFKTTRVAQLIVEREFQQLVLDDQCSQTISSISGQNLPSNFGDQIVFAALYLESYVKLLNEVEANPDDFLADPKMQIAVYPNSTLTLRKLFISLPRRRAICDYFLA